MYTLYLIWTSKLYLISFLQLLARWTRDKMCDNDVSLSDKQRSDMLHLCIAAGYIHKENVKRMQKGSDSIIPRNLPIKPHIRSKTGPCRQVKLNFSNQVSFKKHFKSKGQNTLPKWVLLKSTHVLALENVLIISIENNI